MDNYVVTVGPRAYSFHDQTTGITIVKGQKKELTLRQFNSRKIQRALTSGHLILVVQDSSIKPISDAEVKKMVKKIKAQFAQGMEISKMAKGYNLEQAKALAKSFDIEADPGDTVETLLQAVTDELAKDE